MTVGMNFTPLCYYSTSQILELSGLTATHKPSVWHTELPTWHQLVPVGAGGSAYAQGL